MATLLRDLAAFPSPPSIYINRLISKTLKVQKD